MEERIKEHLQYIKHKKNQPTGEHFNKKDQGIEYFSWSVLEQIHYPNPSYRKVREKFRIDQFRVIEPQGLNRKSSN